MNEQLVLDAIEQWLLAEYPTGVAFMYRDGNSVYVDLINGETTRIDVTIAHLITPGAAS